MIKLREIYENVQSPLDTPETIKKIVDAYQISARTTTIGAPGMYDALVNLDSAKDESEIDLRDREKFYINTYNQWIQNMINLSPEQIEQLEKGNINAQNMQKYLSDFGFVRTMEDIERLKSNSLFDKEKNGWELDDGWMHIKSRYITGQQEQRIDVKHRLYIGCQNQDMWKMMRLFKDKCEKQGIPYYFKSASSSNRADKIVIYSDTKNLASYISILQEIARENVEIVQRCGNPPVLTGRIDEWIGIGDEPPLKSNGEKQSYNTLRAEILENAIEETLLKSIQEYKGKEIEYNGRKGVFDGLLLKQATEYLVSKLTPKQAEKLNITEADIKSGSLSEQIKKHLKPKIQLGLDKLWDVKDRKSELGTSNGDAIFSIPTRNGKKLDVNTWDMDKILKTMLPIMQEIEPKFMDKVRQTIDLKCQQSEIDSTFCFRQETKEDFEQVDSIVAKQDDFFAEKAKSFREELQETKQPSSQQQDGFYAKKAKCFRASLKEKTKVNNGIVDIDDTTTSSRNNGRKLGKGLSQAQQEKLQRDAEARQRIEQEGQQGAEQAKTPKKIAKKALHSDIVDTKISTSEKDKSMQKTRDILRAQLLYNKFKKGEVLNAHDQQIAIEYEQKLEKQRREAVKRRAQKKSLGQSRGR